MPSATFTFYVDDESGAKPVSKTMVLLVMPEAVVVDSAYYSLDNYAIGVTSGTGPVRLRRVLETNETVTRNIFLVTDYMTEGTTYSVVFSLLNKRDGTTLSGTYSFTYSTTKTDLGLRSIPGHFDKKPESNIAAIMTAITMSDQDIGGSTLDS